MSTNFHCSAGTGSRSGIDDLGQRLQARIRHFNHADVGFDRAEWVVFGGDTRFGQGVEQGDLPTFGKPTMPHLRLMTESF